MKIVVLDGSLLNPGDLSWDTLKALGNCEIFDATPPEKTVERCQNAEIAFTNKVVFSKEVIENLPNLKYIGETATGYDNIDVKAAKEKGIVVTNVPAYGTKSVAQHTFALLLEITNQVGVHNVSVKKDEWVKAPNFCYWKTPLSDLENLTLGVIGYGAIGRATADLGRAFGMKILVNNRSQKDPDVDYVDQETLFRNSDVITLHCMLTPETKGLISEKTLGWMKKDAILLNASRGALVNEWDLANALQEKKIRAAGLDVLENEPPKADCPLLHLDNCYITPHIAWATKEARERLLEIAVKNLEAFLGGNPHNVVG